MTIRFLHVRLGVRETLGLLLLVLAVPTGFAGKPAKPAPPKPPAQHTGTVQSTRLYTAPDDSAGGGIRGHINASNGQAVAVLAVPQEQIERVYRIQPSQDGEFIFNGLPVGKYDLMVVFPDRFYEGFKLAKSADALTDTDRKQIEAIINSSVPFFDTKKVHRAMGTTGPEGEAKCVLQEVRTRAITLQSAEVRSDIQIRSLKLANVSRVGEPGWQLVDTRELMRTEVLATEPRGVIGHQFVAALGGIRVVDAIKEIGELSLH